MTVLRTEAQPEPGIEQGGVGRRHERVVRSQALLDPARRRLRPDVSQALRVARRVPGRLDPDVRAPALYRTGLAQHVRALREGAGRALFQERGDLRAVVGFGQLREDAAVRLVPRREQLGRRVEVLFCEGDDLHGAVHSQRCRRRRSRVPSST